MSLGNNTSLAALVENNHLSALQKRLRSGVSPDELSQAFGAALHRRRTECVRALVSHAKEDVPIMQSAFEDAAYYGHLEALQLLLPHVKPAWGASKAWVTALRENHADCHAFLRPHSDPLDAWHEAIMQGDRALLMILADWVPVESWREAVDTYSPDMLGDLRARLHRHDERVALEQALVARESLPVPRTRL